MGQAPSRNHATPPPPLLLLLLLRDASTEPAAAAAAASAPAISAAATDALKSAGSITTPPCTCTSFKADAAADEFDSVVAVAWRGRGTEPGNRPGQKGGHDTDRESGPSLLLTTSPPNAAEEEEFSVALS